MAYTADEFLALGTETTTSPVPKCVQCNCVLHEVSTGNRWTADGLKCSDCYFEALGDAVEQSPIVTARIRRG